MALLVTFWKHLNGQKRQLETQFALPVPPGAAWSSGLFGVPVDVLHQEGGSGLPRGRQLHAVALRR